MSLFKKHTEGKIVLSTEVKKIGSGAREFLAEKMIIFFGDKAPEYLAEHCFIIGDTSGDYPLSVGDTLGIGNSRYKITAVGDVAKQNFQALGHLVVQFDGAKKANQPGMIHVEAKAMPDIAVGTLLTLEHA